MLDHLRRRLTYANVIATIAVFGVVAGGGAYAASKLGPGDIAKNAVRAKHVKKNQIKAKHGARNSVRTRHLGNRAVTAPKLRHGGTLYGRAPAAGNRTLLLSWPAMGLAVRTHDAGAPDSPFQVRVVNTNPPGGTRFWVSTDGGASQIQPGASAAFGGLSGLDARVVENGGSGRMVRLDCFANVIAQGDDQFMQCMALTAGPK